MLFQLLTLIVVVFLIVVLAAIPKNSLLVSILVKTNNYLPCHILLTFIGTVLGKHGKHLKERSLVNLMESVQHIYVPAVDQHKKTLFAGLTNPTVDNKDKNNASGRGEKRLTILEIGIGTGGNFQYYPKECDLLVVEPNGEFEEKFLENLNQHKGIKLIGNYQIGAEDMKVINDNSVDAVITTLVLCSMGDVNKALHEIFRVLKPGGKYYLLDHMGGAKPSLVERILMSIARFLHTDHGHGKGSGCGGHGVDSKLKHIGFSDVQFSNVKLTYSEKSLVCEKMANHRLGIATK